MATKDKNIWILLIFILSGLVIGGLLGDFASKVDFLWWLSYGESFGISNPITLTPRLSNSTAIGIPTYPSPTTATKILFLLHFPVPANIIS